MSDMLTEIQWNLTNNHIARQIQIVYSLQTLHIQSSAVKCNAAEFKSLLLSGATYSTRPGSICSNRKR